jgi:hypothetical protein
LVVNQAQKQQRKKKKTKSNKYVPEWFNLVCDPFGHSPCSIPDEDTRPSFKFSSEYYEEVTTKYTGAVTGLNPSVIISMMPSMDIVSGGSNDGVVGKYFPDATYTYDPTGVVVGSLDALVAVPNAAAMTPSLTDGTTYSNQSHRIRCTSMGLRIFPLMPELSRGGSIMTGQIQPPDNAGSSVAAICNPLNLAFTGDAAVSESAIRQRLSHLSRTRMPDGSVELHWTPQKIPKYHEKIIAADLPTVTGFLQTQPSFPTALIVDNLTTASLTGNAYAIQYKWHWEVSTTAYLQMVGTPTPSVYSARDIEYCINNFPRVHHSHVDVGVGIHPISGERDVSVSPTPNILEPLGNVAREALGNVVGDPNFQSKAAQLAAGVALGALGLTQGRLRR